MDPITIFSLFCNVITVVDAAVKTTRGLKELYDSGTGFSKAHQQIEEESRRLSDIAKELSESRDHLSSYASPQRPLVEKVAQECTKVAKQIQLVLGECKVDSQAPKTVAVLKAWVKSKTRKSELDELQTEFDSCVDGLRMAMAAATRADLSSMKETLAKIAVGQRDLIEKMSLITKQLLSQQATLPNLNQSLSLAEEAKLMINHGLIIRALKPLTIESRESEVAVRYNKTFDWIVDPETNTQTLGTTTTFVDWLKDGSGVFHFSGKPGSGKSTLMKFLVNEPRVMEFLRKWAEKRGKILAVTKFFFWRPGSNEQKSVSGLLRGLLYEMCLDSPELAKLLFPEVFTSEPHRQGSEIRISNEQIRQAFELLRLDPHIGTKFALCFFIDGLDEFDGAEMAHWRLAKMLRDWSAGTDNGINMKLCISSREDHAILAAFENCQRVRLHDITHDDICSLVQDTLDSNEYFQRLKTCDGQGSCGGLVERILEGADGVFLWVSILLNLLEDELPSVSSVHQLYKIVDTTPSRLEDFIGSLLNTIPKHHRRGAYFTLAMALRMMGFHLSDTTQFPASEDCMYRKLFESGWQWRPYLPVYGLSVVMEILETNPNTLFPGYRDILAKVQSTDHERRSENAANTIRNWCKGLLDVVAGVQKKPHENSNGEIDYDHSDFLLTLIPGSQIRNAEYKFTIAKFMHRAIPESLISIIRDQASHYRFHDQDVAEGILIAIITETSSSYNDQEPLFGANLTLYLQHVLRLLRMRPIEPTSNIFLLLDDLERIRFNVWLRTESHTSAMLPPGSQQLFELVCWSRFVTDYADDSPSAHFALALAWNRSATVLARASYAGLYEYMQWKFKPRDTASRMPISLPLATGHLRATNEYHNLQFSALCGLIPYGHLLQDEFPVAYTETLKVLVSVGVLLRGPTGVTILEKRGGRDGDAEVVRFHVDSRAPLKMAPLQDQFFQHLPLQWPWISVIPMVLNVLVTKTSPPGVWSFLEVWLIGADMPAPYGIWCGFELSEPMHSAEWGTYSVNSAPRARSSSPLTVGCRIKVTYGKGGPSSSNESSDGACKHIFQGSFAKVLARKFNAHPVEYAMSARDNLASCFGSPRPVKEHIVFNEVSLADLVRYHSPPNKEVLLEHLRKRGYDSAVGTGES